MYRLMAGDASAFGYHIDVVAKQMGQHIVDAARPADLDTVHHGRKDQ